MAAFHSKVGHRYLPAFLSREPEGLIRQAGGPALPRMRGFKAQRSGGTGTQRSGGTGGDKCAG